MKALAKFPDIETLKRRMQSAAVLDALLCPEWANRWFSFDKNWGVGESMGSVRNGCGDDLFAVFSDAGCYIKEFYHEKTILDAPYIHVPAAFKETTLEPAFSSENVTACYWQERQIGSWEMNRNGRKADSVNSVFLASLDGNPETYEAFSEAYYGRVLPPIFIDKIYKHQVFTRRDVEGVGYEGEYEELKQDLDQIGYSSALP